MLQIKIHILTVIVFINIVSVLSFHIDTNHTIVYEDVRSSPSRPTYFGYSVVIHTGKEHWIHIGAPRGNSTYAKHVREPGIVYQCEIGEICKEVNLNGKANEKNFKNENKANAWIGVSMTIITGREKETVVVCGHRWKDTSPQALKVSVPANTGACYMIPTDNKKIRKQCKLVPASGDYLTTVRDGNRDTVILYTAMGQAGISSHYPEKTENHKDGDRHLTLGAPGTLNWQGVTVFYDISQEKTCGAYSSHRTGPDFNYFPSYFGYAVSSGYLIPNEPLVYAVSAPRASRGNGLVLLYHYTEKQKIMPIIEITGTQIGEYFGASIATADINQDGIDDLIIGAPRYSTPSDPDQGRIYISLGGEIAVKQMQHFDGRERNAQFGTTVAAIGDINNDGFEDIAVGAPYSNGYTGSVYVYRGGKYGLTPTQVQVLHANLINPSLRGFGISIHHTAEKCQRNKTYMAIGAHLSGHVTVLRSYPVISLHVQLNSSVPTVQKSNNNFSLTVCSWYNARCGPSKISVTRKILFDPEYNRIHIEHENTEKHSHEEIIILEESYKSCKNFFVYIHELKEREERVKDNIVIEASLTLNNNKQEQSTLLIKTDGTQTGTDNFCRNCSIVNWETSKWVDTLRLSYSDCGNDNICDSELHLNCGFPDINGTFLIGSSSELKLKFEFTNKKEPAYQSILHVQIPEPVKSLRLHRNCSKTMSLTDTFLQCNLNSTLDYNDEGEFTVELDMSHLDEKDLLSVTFNAWLTTTSKNNGEYNQCQLDLKVKATASMYMVGRSSKEMVPYYSGAAVMFEQSYQVYKVGDSPVRKAEIKIDVPHLLRFPGEKNTFLTIKQFEATQGQFVIRCASNPPLPTSTYNATLPDIQEVNSIITEGKSIETEHSRAKRELTRNLKLPEANENVSMSSSDNILYINCTSEDVDCQKITCTSGFTDTKALLSIKFIAELNTLALENIMKKKNIIKLSTNGSVYVKEPGNLVPYDTDSLSRMESALTTTTFTLDLSEKEVAVWVIAVSAICGVFVLILIIIVLRKVGFFKRKKKEALQQLLASTITEDFYYQKNNDVIPAQMAEESDSIAEIIESECNE